MPSPFSFLKDLQADLTFTNPKQLGAAYWARALRRRSAVFHCDFLGILHFPFGPALHTISLH
jgi:hypothetical protein